MLWNPIKDGHYVWQTLEPWFALPEFQPVSEPVLIHVSEDILKSVLFVGTKEHGKFIPKATAFIVSIAEGDIGTRYLVTADHVIAALQSRGKEIWIRSNRLNGTTQEDNWSAAHWWFHPDVGSTDVALASVDFTADEDFKSIPLSDVPGRESMAGTRARLRTHNAHLGQQVYVAGLFRSHYGRQRNVPIIRTGNIAMMMGEKVYTAHCNYTDAYLVETRSISGLSGSPVFVELDVWLGGRVVDKRVALLGLMHGHFDTPNLKEDVVADVGKDSELRGINTGIGVIIPVEKILETIYQPELAAVRKEAIEQFKKTHAAKADVDVSASEDLSKDANPQHQEDFTSLLNAAARKPTQAG